MARTFTRIGKDIVLAVKNGGPDPDTNGRLRAIIQNAKAANMPKENIDRAIKKASSKDQEDYKEITYEGYGPHGIAIVIETATDNHNRTVANVRSYFNKYGGALGTQGMLDFMFDRKSVFRIKATGVDLEELEFEAIDYGADEIELDEEAGQILIYGDFTAFGTLQKFLEEKNFDVQQAEFERIPTDTKELSEEETAELDKLLEKIEEDDDVQMVYTNVR